MTDSSIRQMADTFSPAAHLSQSKWCHNRHSLMVRSGVVREKVGDILVMGEAGAQILVDPDLVEHFEVSHGRQCQWPERLGQDSA